ncbi:MAG: hypothetical protein ACO3JL_05040 [Myxococcota bacterium]
MSRLRYPDAGLVQATNYPAHSMNPEKPLTEGFVWRRQDFAIALLGQAACSLGPALVAAGYHVVAHRLAEAEQAFSTEQSPTVMVVDFSDEERPPEAVPLLARSHRAGERFLALVHGHDGGAFRRAFLAGARDVVAWPARTEDVLHAIDAIVEPVALRAAWDRLRQQALREETQGLPPSEHARLEPQRVEAIALAAQLAETQRELERVREQAKEERSRLWAQLVDVMQERDRALVAGGRSLRVGRVFAPGDDEEQRRWDLLEQENKTLTSALADARATAAGLRRELEEAHQVLRQVASIEQVAVGNLDETGPMDRCDSVEGALEQRARDEERLALLDKLLTRRAKLEQQVMKAREAWLPWSDDVDDDTGPDLSWATAEEVEGDRTAASEALSEQHQLEQQVQSLVAELAEPTHPGLGRSLILELSRLAEAYDEACRDLEALRSERQALMHESEPCKEARARKS